MTLKRRAHSLAMAIGVGAVHRDRAYRAIEAALLCEREDCIKVAEQVQALNPSSTAAEVIIQIIREQT